MTMSHTVTYSNTEVVMTLSTLRKAHDAIAPGESRSATAFVLGALAA